MTTVRWIGVGMAALFGVTVAMLVRSSAGAGSVQLKEARALTPKWTDEDVAALVAAARRLRMSPADLALVLASESGLDPAAANRNSEGYPVAVGLNQLTAAANGHMGMTEAERLGVPKMSVARQIPLVERYFARIGWTKSGKPYDHAGVVYLANAAGGRLSRGTSRGVVVYDEEDDPDGYAGNRGLDFDGDGQITVGDLIDHLRAKVAVKPVYKAMLARLRAATGDSGLSPRLPSG
jgi:hypothetical protein